MLAALAVHALSFWGVVHAVRIVGGHQVAMQAWVLLFAAGAVVVAAAARGGLRYVDMRRAALFLLYAVLLGVWFWGVDVALQILGNSVKPRVPLPAFLGGLEFYFVLVPGLASAALGVLAARLPTPLAPLRSWLRRVGTSTPPAA